MGLFGALPARAVWWLWILVRSRDGDVGDDGSGLRWNFFSAQPKAGFTGVGAYDTVQRNGTSWAG